ncbi:MAG TPA: M36 family metallopeptidase [Gaiellaceae bacterium]|nr:M36 family metallopeptidase [Gaiellaceae bacterium]
MRAPRRFAGRLRRSAPISLLVAATAALVLVLVPTAALGVLKTGTTAAKPDLNVNAGVVEPTAAQQRLVARLGAHASWNRFGTPSSLIKLKGYLATGLGGDAVTAARTFLEDNKGLYRLSSAKSLELVNDIRLTGSKAHAVLFAQRFGNLVADWEGLIAVGVVDGKVAYVSSSAAGSKPVTGSVKLTAAQAWTAAAKSVGVPADGGFGKPLTVDGWTYFDVGALTGVQSLRKTAVHADLGTPVPTPTLPPLPPLPTDTSGTTGTVTGTVDGATGAAGGATGSTATVDTTALLQKLQAKIDSLLAAGAQQASGSGQSSAQASASQVAVPAVHQGAKLVAFPTLHDGVRPAWLVNVVDLRNVAAPKAYQIMVDADNGAVLFRHDAVQELSTQATAGQPAYSFTGAYAPPNCDADQVFAVDSGQKSIAAAASAVNPSNDIVLELIDPSGKVVSSSDTATSPEAVTYQDKTGSGLAVGNWALRVCPFNGDSLQPPVPNQTPPYTYVAAAAVTSAAATVPNTPRPAPPTAVTNNPRWAFFPSFPGLDYGLTQQTEGCWQDTNDGLGQPAACAQTFANAYSPFGWDVIPRTNQATLTTRGNNAFTAEAWLSPLTPAEQRSPVSTDRYYDRSFPGGNFVWTNSWNTNKCDPTTLGDPTRNNADIDAATTNLFVMHNRMHDFSYALGFTEQAYNAQLDNLDKGTGTGPYPVGSEGDPELGNAQAGALDGGAPSYEGRDNANQIALNDGVPGITNQYLWQPIADAFYSPCTDGSFDLSVAGHEYTHLISNRMVGGPDASLSSAQGGAMGESWSDLDALEYLHEYGLAGAMGEDPWSLGAYVTGNPHRGIRDYALDENPLNFSDIGFDTPGVEVHADGEIWNGVNYELRQALVARYGEGTTAENVACAQGKTPVAQCSGGRRWIQLVYDAWLLEQADLSMVDARDAMLAADLMRFGGADEATLWHAFAKRGLGIGATSVTGDDGQPTPSFASPKEANAQVSFVTTALDGANAGKPVAASVYVGDFQARVTPVADTDTTTALGNTAGFVPGTYDLVVQAPGYGLVKLSRTLDATAQTLTIALPHNWASAASGATASGDGANQANLVDDNEETNWSSTSGVAGQQVTVTLNGRHVLTGARVSAFIDPSETRFEALRSFTIQACDASTTNCSVDGNWVTAYDSADDAFPGTAPRPVAPDLILRSFPIADVPATVVRLVVKANQCTGGPAFQGEQDNDPSNDTACPTSADGSTVSAAELELVSSDSTVTASSGMTQATTGGSTTSTGTQAQTRSGTGSSASTAKGSTAKGSAAKPAAEPAAKPSASGASSASQGGTTTAPSTTVVPAASGVSAGKVTLRRLYAHGVLRLRGSRARVALTVNVLARGGVVRFSDALHHVSFGTRLLRTVNVNYRTKTAVLTGRARLHGKLVVFRLRLTDGKRVDSFAIRLGRHYALAGKLGANAIRI